MCDELKTEMGFLSVLIRGFAWDTYLAGSNPNCFILTYLFTLVARRLLNKFQVSSVLFASRRTRIIVRDSGSKSGLIGVVSSGRSVVVGILTAIKENQRKAA